jgi:hypothetical protein
MRKLPVAASRPGTRGPWAVLGGAAMRKLLIGVIILAVLLVAADRISVAENQISDRLTSAYGLAGNPA